MNKRERESITWVLLLFILLSVFYISCAFSTHITDRRHSLPFELKTSYTVTFVCPCKASHQGRLYSPSEIPYDQKAGGRKCYFLKNYGSSCGVGEKTLRGLSLPFILLKLSWFQNCYLIAPSQELRVLPDSIISGKECRGWIQTQLDQGQITSQGLNGKSWAKSRRRPQCEESSSIVTFCRM